MLRGLLTTALLALCADAQSRVYHLEGRLSGDQYGGAVSEAGDMNGDGVPDFLAGAPRAVIGPSERGLANLFSGHTGAVLDTWIGAEAGARFGSAIAPSADLDGDLIPDVAISAPKSTNLGLPVGRVFVYSSATGLELRQYTGSTANALYGSSIADVGDVDGDLIPDLAVGIPQAASGRVIVYSGATGSVAYDKVGDSAGDLLGFSVAGVGDVNGDGTPDFAAGAPRDDDGGPEAGSIRVYSGFDGSTLYTFHGDAAGAQLGYSVAGGGFVDADAFADVIGGADEDGTNGTKAGLARIYSGFDGSIIRTHLGGASEDRTGRSVAMLGDVNGDGRDDVAVGALRDDDGALDAGSVIVFSGLDGALLGRFDGATAGDELGAELAVAGDVNGDGVSELIMGLPKADTTGGTDTGLVRLGSPVTMPLWAERHLVSLVAGGTEDMHLEAGAAHAGSIYWVLGSVTGTSPGVVVGGMNLPVNLDDYMRLTFKFGDPLFQTFLGLLDVNGEASAALILPPGLDPAFAGFVVHHAYMVVSTPGIADMTSNPVPLTLLP